MIISEQASGYGSMSYGNGHGHSCDHVTSRFSAGYIIRCKYQNINKLYRYRFSPTLRSHGHSCDRVTIHPAEKLSYY